MADEQVQLPKGYEDYKPKSLGLVLPPGYESYVPKGAKKISENFESAGKEIIDNSPSYAGRMAVEGLPMLAAALTDGASVPIQMGATALASGLGMAAKATAPSVFGAAPEGMGDAALDFGSDQLANVGIPRALQKVVGSVVRNGIKGPLVDTLANKFVQKISPSVGESVEGARIGSLTKDLPIEENSYVKTILSKGVKNGKVTDPEAMLKELNSGPYHFTVSPESKVAIEELAQNTKLSGDITDKVLGYAKKRLVLGAAGAVLGGSLGHIGEGAAGIVLTDAMLGHLMSNPNTAKLVVAAMRTPKTAPQATMLTRLLANSVRGAELPLLTKDQ